MAHLLLVSKNPLDLAFAKLLAARTGSNLFSAFDPMEVRKFLVEHPDAVVFWDASDAKEITRVNDMILCSQDPSKVIIVTDRPIQESDYLLKTPAFGHHCLRRYDAANSANSMALELMSRLIIGIQSLEKGKPFGILRYFPENSASQKIKMLRSGQRFAATNAVEGFLKKHDIASRLASMVAQYSDELLMNAIYDAPADENAACSSSLERTVDFEFSARQEVELEIASCKEYLGMSVGDQFGSLRRSKILEILGATSKDGGQALGLGGLMNSGLSVFYVAKAGKRTEVIVFFKRTPSFKAFQTGFRVTSILTD